MMLSMSLVQENYPWTRTMSGDLTVKMSTKRKPGYADLRSRVSGQNAGRN